jgi:hypothetical protein
MINVLRKVRLVLPFAVLACQTLSYGQAKQTYNGTFNSSNFHGVAVYQYSEDNTQQRIFDGTFTFDSKALNSSVSISGGYHNNQKQGPWKMKLTNVAHSDIVMKYVITANVTGVFKDGNLDGPWSLNRTKVVSFSKSGISTYYQTNINALSYLFDGKKLDFSKSSTVSEVAKVNFKDNHFVGDFSYNVGSNSKVTGQFDQDGYFTGTWTISYYDNGILYTELRNYLNGVLLTTKTKDNSTGDIRTVYDKTSEVTEFFQNYNKDQNTSKKGEQYLKLSANNGISGERRFLNDAISIWYNNSSLDLSAYNFEIIKGTNKMSVFPERTIVNDEAKMDDARKVAEENERLENEKKRQEAEVERERLRKLREYERTDYARLKEAIKKEFSGWLVKGTYETQQDYESRIKTETNSKFKNIVAEKIAASKPSATKRPRYGVLGQYNADNQTFPLYYGNYNRYGGYSENNNLKLDTIFIPVPNKLAPALASKFSKESTDGKKIYVLTSDASMVNNSWKITGVTVLFDNFWMGNTFCDAKNGFYKEAGVYHYDRDENNYQKMAKENKRYDCTDFKTILDKDKLPSAVYFYEVNSTANINPEALQGLEFSIESMGVDIPKF